MYAALSAARSSSPGPRAGALPWGYRVLAGFVASSWHGIAFTELASIAGVAHTGTALGLGNTFAFGAYFLAPLVFPHVLERANWSGVWLTAAFVLFPKATAAAGR